MRNTEKPPEENNDDEWNDCDTEENNAFQFTGSLMRMHIPNVIV
jgi:hypothetical protein